MNRHLEEIVRLQSEWQSAHKAFREKIEAEATAERQRRAAIWAENAKTVEESERVRLYGTDAHAMPDPVFRSEMLKRFGVRV